MKVDPEQVLRQAIELVQPSYFQWTSTQREKYGWEISNDDYFQIKQYLLRSLFDIAVESKKDLKDVLNGFSPDEWRVLNETQLPLFGMGDDCLYLNEPLRQPLDSYLNLNEYACEQYKFQEEANLRDFPKYQAQPYLGTLWHASAQLKVNNEFSYATLCNMAEYLTEELQHFCQNQLDDLIPHKYVEGPEHMQETNDGHLTWDMVQDADGREGQLVWLQTETFRHIHNQYLSLGTEFNEQPSCETYVLDTIDFDGEKRKEFVFSDIEALKAVSFGHFLKDCTAIESDSDIPVSRLETEKQILDMFLKEKYEYVMENYDPKMIESQEKRKVVMSHQALDSIRRG